MRFKRSGNIAAKVAAVGERDERKLRDARIETRRAAWQKRRMQSPLPESLQTALASRNATTALREILRHFSAQAGTVHWLDLQSGLLTLGAHQNIPPHIAEIVGTVPIGKGIAGLAAQKREPIALCNLQTDTSGQARPAAKSTGMEGSLAVPMLVEGELRGVLGVAKAEAHDWTADEKALLLAYASGMGQFAS
jgi:GAF domain-containing protein